MATKIRLQRHGRKGYAFYSIVIADVRAPRDGKFTEKIGTYNPNTNPATVDLKFDRALYWVEVGAQPTDTVRNILSKEGVYMMKHLRGGVKKGAFDEAAAQAKFEAWKQDKQKGIEAFEAKKVAEKKAAAEARLQAEKKINDLYKTWSERYNDKEPIEIMGMVAFRFAQLYQSLAEEVGETDLMLEDFENSLNSLLLTIQGIDKSDE